MHLALRFEGIEFGESISAWAFQVVPGGLSLLHALHCALKEAQRLQRLPSRQVRPRREETPQRLERGPLQATQSTHTSAPANFSSMSHGTLQQFDYWSICWQLKDARAIPKQAGVQVDGRAQPTCNMYAHQHNM